MSYVLDPPRHVGTTTVRALSRIERQVHLGRSGGHVRMARHPVAIRIDKGGTRRIFNLTGRDLDAEALALLLEGDTQGDP